MNPAILTPRAVAALEEGCYLLTERAWNDLAHVEAALQSLIELTESEKKDIQLSVEGFHGLVSTLATVIITVQTSLIWQPPCIAPKNAP